MKRYLTVVLLVCFSLFFVWCAYGVNDDPDADIHDAKVTDVKSDGPPPLPDAALQLRDASISYGGFDYGSPHTMHMEYQGGKVMTNPVHVYLIWYGNWQNSRTVPIIEDLITNIGSSDWFKANTFYYQLSHVDVVDSGVFVGDAGPNTPAVDASDDADAAPPPVYVTNQVLLSKEVFIGYTHGYSLSDTAISDIVSEQIDANQLPLDEDGVYFVLTDKYVSQGSGFGTFCGLYCGWHEHIQIKGADIKYSFVGDVERCPNDCSAKADYFSVGYPQSPNGDWSADGMSTIIAHELSETVTDPDINAWQDSLGYENADKCAWTFGLVYVTSNNSVANVKIGSREWLIQQNWFLDNDKIIQSNYCTLGN